ncbi:MAG: YfcE family phosphodiesterase [Dehalococcoidales bacterium]|nr:YfcE family phosphodiesterase [Dehalococcoidales bacterium]
MRIGLLSDTHIPEVERELPLELVEAFRGVDLILHAGDIYLPSVLDELERIAPVLAASGDDDDFTGILADERVKEKHILKFQGQTLWLVHQRPDYLTSQWWQDKHSSGQDCPGIVVFGHEHRTSVQQVDGTLFINPGSPTFLSYLRGLGTIGILDINSGEADIHIVRL